MPSKLVMETPLEPRATDKQLCATSQCSYQGEKSLFGFTQELILCFAKGLAAMGTTPSLLSPFAMCC